jgi:hypothetical protein
MANISRPTSKMIVIVGLHYNRVYVILFATDAIYINHDDLSYYNAFLHNKIPQAEIALAHQ